MAYPTFYGGYPQAQGGYYPPPMQDHLAQLRQQQYQPPMMQPAVPAQQSDNDITWVQGEEGAKGYLVAPGKSKLLMDSENPVFFIKSVDVSGMPHPLRIFDYTERTGERAAKPVLEDVKYARQSDLDDLKAKVLELSALIQEKEEPENAEPSV